MRLFIAVNFDRETKERLLVLQQRLKECGTGNFTREENLHLTVLFLGEVKDGTAARRSIDTNFHTPVKLVFNKTGKFKNNLYWVGIRRNPVLNELYDKFCNDLKQEDDKVDGNRRFSPHITLVREAVLKSRPDLNFEEFSMVARRVSLMKSERIGGRLVYTEVYGKSI